MSLLPLALASMTESCLIGQFVQKHPLIGVQVGRTMECFGIDILQKLIDYRTHILGSSILVILYYLLFLLKEEWHFFFRVAGRKKYITLGLSSCFCSFIFSLDVAVFSFLMAAPAVAAFRRSLFGASATALLLAPLQLDAVLLISLGMESLKVSSRPSGLAISILFTRCWYCIAERT